MDWLTFISNMTAAIAWPATVLIVGAVYKEELKRFFITIKKLKLGPMEAEMFEAKAKEAKELAESLVPPQSGEPAEMPSISSGVPATTTPPPAKHSRLNAEEDRLLEMVGQRPRLALIEAWKLVEGAVDALTAGRSEASLRTGATFMTRVFGLQRSGAITAEQVAVVRKLYELYNNAVTTTIVFSEDAVLDYIVAASNLLRALEPHTSPRASR